MGVAGTRRPLYASHKGRCGLCPRRRARRRKCPRLAVVRCGPRPRAASWQKAIKNVQTSVETTIREKLTQAFQPARLEVVNESHLHAGHRNSPGTGETHFRVLIVSPLFAGKSRLARHRLVNET